MKPAELKRKNEKIYAVITGDIIGSQKWNVNDREYFLNNLKVSLDIIEEYFALPYEVFRGDSFQGIVSQPEHAAKAAILLRANLLSHYDKRNRLDARISIGIGRIDFFPEKDVGEGDGEAFRYSGLELDKIKKKKINFIITTPWAEVNEELRTECALLDALVRRWSKEQAEAMFWYVKGLKQEEIGEKLGINQSTAHQRLKLGGYIGVQEFLQRYEELIRKSVESELKRRAIQ